MDIVVEDIESPSDDPVEIVERKGLGHPDTLCDGIAEAVSTALYETYVDTFGHVPHYNTDQVQLGAGETETRLGEGQLVESASIHIVGRATDRYNGQQISVDDIAVEAAEEHLRGIFGADADRLFNVQADLRTGSAELQGLAEGAARSNDTSYGVGHYPLSQTEETVMAVERSLVADEHPAVGTDIKVMGTRHENTLTLTVAAAILCEQVETVSEYEQVVDDVRERATAVAEDNFDGTISVTVNAADDPENGDMYLTQFGTSAEHGDDGSVGRGNRYNGLITPRRSMSLEAHSGKHKIAHVGRRYNELATQLSAEIVDQTEAGEAQTSLVSAIGAPVDDPRLVLVEADAGDDAVQEVVEAALDGM